MRHSIKRSAVVANGTTRNAIGVDIGDKKSRVCVLGVGGEILEETVIQTSTTGFIKYFERADQAIVAFEIGTHSAWVEQVLRLTGHDVIAANPRKLALISKSNHKTDKRDAMTLAYLAAQSPHLLSPVKQRSPDMRNDLTLLHARAMLVEERTALVNSVRGFVKPTGKRVPTSISTHAFHTKAEVHIPGELKEVLAPLLIVIQSLTQQIDHYDREIEKLCNEKYPQTKRLRQVAGVGPITALAFILIIMDPLRFKNSRQVGPYLGLVPRTYQSGESSPELRITKSGNVLLRSLLVGSAQYILGHFGDRQDSDLRRYGLELAKRGSKKAAKKRAVVAVARKLAVILHRMLVTGESYEPLRNTKRRKTAKASA